MNRIIVVMVGTTISVKSLFVLQVKGLGGGAPGLAWCRGDDKKTLIFDAIPFLFVKTVLS